MDERRHKTIYCKYCGRHTIEVSDEECGRFISCYTCGRIISEDVSVYVTTVGNATELAVRMFGTVRSEIGGTDVRTLQRGRDSNQTNLSVCSYKQRLPQSISSNHLQSKKEVRGEVGEIKRQKTDVDSEAEVDPSLEIKVLFFARARYLVGVSDLSLKVPPGSTASDCLTKIFSQYPSLKEISNCIVLALNREYAPDSVVVNDRDELAIITPISAGPAC